MKERIRYQWLIWLAGAVVGLLFALLGNVVTAEEVVREPITVNAPMAMHEAFEKTLSDLKLNKKYELKFTNSKDANFTVTNQKSDSNEPIAYSPFVAVFNGEKELYEEYIKKGLFVPSENETEKYDCDFKKIMLDIIENPDSIYKVYYPDETMCKWSVFYAFLLYNANDGCYPSGETNMEETKAIVDAFLQSKKTEAISTDAVSKIGGFPKNTVYLIPLSEIGYIYENKHIACRVMYPKITVYCNYYASFDEVGKILFDSLDDNNNGGYYKLMTYGNYHVKQYGGEIKISYSSGRSTISLNFSEQFNAIDVPENIHFSK